jgi:hypothetical protein
MRKHDGVLCKCGRKAEKEENSVVKMKEVVVVSASGRVQSRMSKSGTAVNNGKHSISHCHPRKYVP